MLGIVPHGAVMMVMMPREKRQVEKTEDREKMLLTVVVVDGSKIDGVVLHSMEECKSVVV